MADWQLFLFLSGVLIIFYHPLDLRAAYHILRPSSPLALLSELIAVDGVMNVIGTWHVFNQWGINFSTAES